MDICDYGCSQKANFVFKNKKKCCCRNVKQCPSINEKGVIKRKSSGKPWHDEQTKTKISANHARHQSWCKGLTKDTDKRVAAISNALTGRSKTEATIAAIRNSKKGKRPTYMEGLSHEEISAMRSGNKNPMYDKSHSFATKKILAEMAKGNWSGDKNPWFGRNRSAENSPRWNGETYNRQYRNYCNKVSYYTKLSYDLHAKDINPLGLKRTLAGIDDGYQLDHIVSVRIGFLNEIPPEVIGSRCNLRIISWKDNRDKWYHLTDESAYLLEEMLSKHIKKDTK